MNTQLKERRMDRLISGFGILVYRFLEFIDGEKGIRLILYKIAQQAKMETLIFLEGGVIMKTQRQIILKASILCVCLWAVFAVKAFAQDQNYKGGVDTKSTATEDKTVNVASDTKGDYDTAKSLKEQLKTMHQENVGQKKADKQDLKDAKRELKSDKKETLIEAMDTNNDGKVSQEERQAFHNRRVDTNHDGQIDQSERQAFREKRQEQRDQRRDNDNNPPGPRGGPGTNWENRPGPQGGPGASPDYRPRRDNDNNPPGPRGGPGTNWENRPGPQGGPGASPDRGNHGVRDHGQGQGRDGHGQGGEHRGGRGQKGGGGGHKR